jgi:glucose-6-phosphate dehydrogenase assembly protein OpcA
MSDPGINLNALERSLRQIWQDQSTESGGQSLTRALTLTLIVRVADQAGADTVAAAIPALTASHPSRTVIVIEQAAADPRLAAEVRAVCTLPTPGVPQVCGELIQISAAGVHAGQVIGVILPLILPDLPVVLYAPGAAPLEMPLVSRLRPIVDRLIIDSDTAAAPMRELAALAAAEAEADGAPAFSDLAWTRLTGWRELTAQFFDTRPLIPHLHRIDQIQIDYAAGVAQNAAAALLYISWLAAALNWTPLPDAVGIEGSTIRLHLRRPAVAVGPAAIRLITVELRPVAVAQHHGLTAVILRSLDGTRAEFRIECSPSLNGAHTSAVVEGHAPIERLAAFETLALPALLAAELRLLSRDQTYAAALQIAGGLARRLV